MPVTKRLAAFLAGLLLMGAAEAAELTAEPVVVPPPGTAGRLAWRGGFALESDALAFGGFSELLVAADGRGAMLLSDRGHWLRLRLALEDRQGLHLVGVEGEGAPRPLRDPDGRVVRAPYHDAESLARLPDGSLLVGFERLHRLWRYPSGLDVPAQPVAVPGLRNALPYNKGIEAMTTLRDGGLLLIAEGGGDGASHLPAWLRDAQGAWHRLRYRRTPPFRPTAAALLPDGDVLVLERRFSPLRGFGARLVRIAGATITPSAAMAGEEIARLESPWPTDNFEGLAVYSSEHGETLLFLVSDDNFSMFQRSLLLMFALLPPME